MARYNFSIPEKITGSDRQETSDETRRMLEQRLTLLSGYDYQYPSPYWPTISTDIEAAGTIADVEATGTVEGCLKLISEATEALAKEQYQDPQMKAHWSLALEHEHERYTQLALDARTRLIRAMLPDDPGQADRLRVSAELHARSAILLLLDDSMVSQLDSMDHQGLSRLLASRTSL